jgi:hypothetical protein
MASGATTSTSLGVIATLSVERSFGGDHTEQDRLTTRPRHRPLAQAAGVIVGHDPAARARCCRSGVNGIFAAELEGSVAIRTAPATPTAGVQAAMESGDFRRPTSTSLSTPSRRNASRYRSATPACRSMRASSPITGARSWPEACSFATQPANPVGAFWVTAVQLQFHQGRLDEIGEVTRTADEHPGVVNSPPRMIAGSTSRMRPDSPRRRDGPAGTEPDDLSWLTAWQPWRGSRGDLSSVRLSAALLPTAAVRRQHLDVLPSGRALHQLTASARARGMPSHSAAAAPGASARPSSWPHPPVGQASSRAAPRRAAGRPPAHGQALGAANFRAGRVQRRARSPRRRGHRDLTWRTAASAVVRA